MVPVHTGQRLVFVVEPVRYNTTEHSLTPRALSDLQRCSITTCRLDVLQFLLPLSPSSIIWYQRKLGSKQAYHVVHQPVSRGLALFADAWLSGWLAEISADLRETVAH